MMRFLLCLLFLFPFLASSQNKLTLTGKVIAANEPNGMPGVSIAIKGTSQGTITDVDGSFSMELENGQVLIFSFVGYRAQELTFTGQTNITITLQEDATILDEVIVVGYSSIEKKDITGAITSVKADNLKGLSVSGIDQALQGQAPGVQVTQSSGTPGGGITVRMRGPTSINASNRPLVIIDGIAVETGALSGRNFGGQNDNAVALVPPNDVESIQFLKDASAKAVYGARASNGVIIITTKRGKNARTNISIDVQRGIIDPTHKLELLNSTQLLELQREAVINGGGNPDVLGLIPGVTDAVNTNWQNEVLRRGIVQQYQVAATGGDNATTFYISGTYRKEEGIQLNNSFERLSLTTNFDRKLTERFTLSTNMTMSRALNKRVKGDNFLDGVYSGAVKSLPYYSPFDESGRLIGPSSPQYPSFPNFNPVAQAVLPRFNALTVKVLAGLKGTYSINKDLTLRGQVSLDYNDVTEDQHESSQTAIGGYLLGNGYGVFIAQTLTNVVSNLTLTYSKQLNNNHHVHGLLGAEIYRKFVNGGNLQGREFPSDDFTYIQSAGVVDLGASYKDPPQSLLSYFGEVRYDFKDRILATASFRADASSNFGPNYKWGYFPSASLGWRISKENFFHVPVISDLKLRASYGLTGNQGIPPFSYLATWGSTTYNGGTGVSPNNVANPNIRWEKTSEANVGIDIALWADRVQATFDTYYNKTSDLLLFNPYPLTTGFDGLMDNIGDMENKGIEFSISSVNMQRQNFEWTTRVNLSRNQNKVLFLADPVPTYTGYSAEGVDRTNTISVGHPLGTFWGLNYLGVDPATGNAIYEDRDQDGQISNADAMVIGNTQPKLIGGITNTFNYKGFDLSVFFQFSYGNKVLNLSKGTLVDMGASLDNNQSVDALRRWQEPGDITDIPKYIFTDSPEVNNNLHSSRLIEDASYLRLKNLSLGYSIPKRYTDKVLLGNVRLYFNATNLLTWTKYTGSDPEVSTLDGSTASQGIDFFTLPQVKTLVVGLNITLK
jgi:TonB-dependent starch-binding outer membrane protein SusC